MTTEWWGDDVGLLDKDHALSAGPLSNICNCCHGAPAGDTSTQENTQHSKSSSAWCVLHCHMQRWLDAVLKFPLSCHAPPAKTSQAPWSWVPGLSQKALRRQQEMGFSCQMPIYKAYGRRDWTFHPAKKRSTLQALIKLCPSRENLSVREHSSVSSASLTSKPSFAHSVPISLCKHPQRRLGERQNKVGGGGRGKCEEMANVTKSCLFVFIPMALKFSKSNLLATDMT